MLCSTKIIIKKNPKLCQTHFTKSITLFARFYAIAIGGPEIGRLRHCSDYHTYTSSNLDLLSSITLLFASTISAKQNVLIRCGSIFNLRFADAFFRYKPFHPNSSISSSGQYNNSSNKPCPAEERVYNHGAGQPSGHRYIIQRVLQEKGNPPLRVCLAMYVLLKFDD